MADTGPVQWGRSLVRSRGLPASISELVRRDVQPQGDSVRYIVLDCSASMLRHGQLAKAKGWACSNHLASNHRVSRSFLVLARGTAYEVEPCARQPAAFRRQLDAVVAGGGTPVIQTLTWLAERHRNGQAAEVWVLTDGRFQSKPINLPGNMAVMCIDCELGSVRLGQVKGFAESLGADLASLDATIL